MKPIKHLARRCESDPFFLAYHLRRYREIHGTSREQLAALLGLDADQMDHLALCRAPEGPPEQVERDLQRIGTRFGVSVQALRRVVTAAQ